MWGLEGGSRPWALVIGLVLTSFGWWEAYLPYRTALIVPGLFAYLRDVSIICLHPILKVWQLVNQTGKQKTDKFYRFETKPFTETGSTL